MDNINKLIQAEIDKIIKALNSMGNLDNPEIKKLLEELSLENNLEKLIKIILKNIELIIKLLDISALINLLFSLFTFSSSKLEKTIKNQESKGQINFEQLRQELLLLNTTKNIDSKEAAIEYIRSLINSGQNLNAEEIILLIIKHIEDLETRLILFKELKENLEQEIDIDFIYLWLLFRAKAEKERKKLQEEIIENQEKFNTIEIISMMKNLSSEEMTKEIETVFQNLDLKEVIKYFEKIELDKKELEEREAEKKQEEEQKTLTERIKDTYHLVKESLVNKRENQEIEKEKEAKKQVEKHLQEIELNKN